MNQLDFVWQEQLRKVWNIKFRARNLPDPEVRYAQGDETTREFKRGRELFITLEWFPD